MNARVPRGAVLSTAAAVAVLQPVVVWNLAGGSWGAGSFGVLGSFWGSWGFGTLLGPEESGLLVGVCFFCASFPVWSAVCGPVGLVGPVFDMWIVDASIWQRPAPVCWVVVVV